MTKPNPQTRPRAGFVVPGRPTGEGLMPMPRFRYRYWRCSWSSWTTWPKSGPSPKAGACHRRPYETFVELPELVDLHVHDDHADAQAHARVLATSANGGSMKIPCPVEGVSIMDMAATVQRPLSRCRPSREHARIGRRLQAAGAVPGRAHGLVEPGRFQKSSYIRPYIPAHKAKSPVARPGQVLDFIGRA